MHAGGAAHRKRSPWLGRPFPPESRPKADCEPSPAFARYRPQPMWPVLPDAADASGVISEMAALSEAAAARR